MALHIRVLKDIEGNALVSGLLVFGISVSFFSMLNFGLWTPVVLPTGEISGPTGTSYTVRVFIAFLYFILKHSIPCYVVARTVKRLVVTHSLIFGGIATIPVLVFPRFYAFVDHPLPSFIGVVGPMVICAAVGRLETLRRMKVINK